MTTQVDLQLKEYSMNAPMPISSILAKLRAGNSIRNTQTIAGGTTGSFTPCDIPSLITSANGSVSRAISVFQAVPCDASAETGEIEAILDYIPGSMIPNHEVKCSQQFSSGVGGLDNWNWEKLGRRLEREWDLDEFRGRRRYVFLRDLRQRFQKLEKQIANRHLGIWPDDDIPSNRLLRMMRTRRLDFDQSLAEQVGKIGKTILSSSHWIESAHVNANDLFMSDQSKDASNSLISKQGKPISDERHSALASEVWRLRHELSTLTRHIKLQHSNIDDDDLSMQPELNSELTNDEGNEDYESTFTIIGDWVDGLIAHGHFGKSSSLSSTLPKLDIHEGKRSDMSSTLGSLESTSTKTLKALRSIESSLFISDSRKLESSLYSLLKNRFQHVDASYTSETTSLGVARNSGYLSNSIRDSSLNDHIKTKEVFFSPSESSTYRYGRNEKNTIDNAPNLASDPLGESEQESLEIKIHSLLPNLQDTPNERKSDSYDLGIFKSPPTTSVMVTDQSFHLPTQVPFDFIHDRKRMIHESSVAESNVALKKVKFVVQASPETVTETVTEAEETQHPHNGEKKKERKKRKRMFYKLTMKRKIASKEDADTQLKPLHTLNTSDIEPVSHSAKLLDGSNQKKEKMEKKPKSKSLEKKETSVSGSGNKCIQLKSSNAGSKETQTSSEKPNRAFAKDKEITCQADSKKKNSKSNKSNKPSPIGGADKHGMVIGNINNQEPIMQHSSKSEIVKRKSNKPVLSLKKEIAQNSAQVKTKKMKEPKVLKDTKPTQLVDRLASQKPPEAVKKPRVKSKSSSTLHIKVPQEINMDATSSHSSNLQKAPASSPTRKAVAMTAKHLRRNNEKSSKEPRLIPLTVAKQPQDRAKRTPTPLIIPPNLSTERSVSKSASKYKPTKKISTKATPSIPVGKKDGTNASAIDDEVTDVEVWFNKDGICKLPSSPGFQLPKGMSAESQPSQWSVVSSLRTPSNSSSARKDQLRIQDNYVTVNASELLDEFLQ